MLDIVVCNIYGTYKQSSDVGLITTLWERIVLLYVTNHFLVLNYMPEL